MGAGCALAREPQLLARRYPCRYFDRDSFLLPAFTVGDHFGRRTGCLFKSQGQLIGEILAFHHLRATLKTLKPGITAITASSGKPLPPTSKELAENIAAPSEAEFIEDARKIKVTENVLLAESSAEPLGSEGVVLLSLLLIAQDRISLIDILELGLGRLVTLVSVRVI